MADGSGRAEANRSLYYAVQMPHGTTEADRLAAALEHLVDPQLFIGVGGTGCGVVARLKRRWKLLPEARRRGRVQFFCIDTAGFYENRQDPVVTAHIDPASEYEALCQADQDLSEWYEQLEEGPRDEFDRWVGWYDGRQRPLPSQLNTAGAGAYRQFGRLAFAASFNRAVNQKLVTAAQRLVAASPGGGMAPQGNPQVWVIGGMSGGTGSGIFLDVVRAVHGVLARRSPRVKAVLVLPDVYRESPKVLSAAKHRMRPNAYALLKELDWIIAMDRRKEEYREVGLELPLFDMATTPSLAQFAQPIYLVNNELPRANVSVGVIDELKELTADAVFALSLGISERERQVNFGEWVADETRESRRRKAYAGLGVSRAVVPLFSIVYHLGLLLFAGAAEAGLLDSSTGLSGATRAPSDASNELTDKLMEVCDSRFMARRGQLSLPQFKVDDVADKGQTVAMDDYRRRLAGAADRHLATLRSTHDQTMIEVLAAAQATLDDFISSRHDDLATTIAVLEDTQRALRDARSALAGSRVGTSDGGGNAQRKLAGHSTSILRSALQIFGAPQTERSNALAHNAGKEVREAESRRISEFVDAEQREALAMIADSSAVTEQVGHEPDLLDRAVEAAENARVRLGQAARRAAADTAHFSIQSHVDGEVGVSTWLFPGQLRAERPDDDGPDRYLRSLAEDIGVGRPADLSKLAEDALKRARNAAPGFALSRLAESPGAGDAADYLDILRGAFMQVAEERLAGVAPHIMSGVLAAARNDGVTLADICDRLTTYGQPFLRLTAVAQSEGGGPGDRALISWLAPPDCTQGIDALGLANSATYVGPSDHEITRIASVYGLAVEDLHGIPEYRREYRTFLTEHCTDSMTGNVRTVHVAKGLASAIEDPIGAAQDAERTEDANERFALGLLLGKLFESSNKDAAAVASLKKIVSDVPANLRAAEMLPSPIVVTVRGRERRYSIADYRLRDTHRGPEVWLASLNYLDLGATISEAVETLMAGVGDRAPAIEVLAELVLSGQGPFARTPQEAVEKLKTFREWLQRESDRAADRAEADALDRLCKEVQEEIQEKEALFDSNPFPPV